MSARRARSALVLFGTRPEVIKLAPVLRQLTHTSALRGIAVSTGQHREMLDRMLEDLDVVPVEDLGVMREDQALAELTSRLVAACDAAIERHHPQVVIVQGDTTTAMCAALAAFYRRVPVGHVEAGLRSGVPDDPFPEEMNRRIVSRIARWHFAPTERAQTNLIAEGVSPADIDVTGNTVVDNLLWVLERGKGTSAFRTQARRKVLVTLHRRESQGERMRGLAAALARIALAGNTEVLLPLHMSPKVREDLVPELESAPGLTLLEHLSYVDFVASLAACDLVLTDSGGVQEEAPTLSKPVLVLRGTTERPEAIEAGVAVRIGVDPEDVYRETMRLFDDTAAYSAMAGRANPFGDGRAAGRVVERLVRDLGGG